MRIRVDNPEDFESPRAEPIKHPEPRILNGLRVSRRHHILRVRRVRDWREARA